MRRPFAVLVPDFDALSRISKPLITLMKAFSKISHADFSIRLEDGIIREFNKLQQMFNRMTATIEELLLRQHQQNEELEHKVAERTDALRQAMPAAAPI